MIKSLITTKMGMTSTISEDGAVQAVTLLACQPHVVTQVKTNETDGYSAVQFGTGSSKKLGKSLLGHLKASKATPKIMREIRVNEIDEDISVGTTFKADVFSVGDTVNVTATTKGKGFAGTIRRHNFHRQRQTHGGKGNTRKPGSIGSMYPQHILKGTRMAGQLGHVQVTTRNLKVALVDAEKNIIGVTGAVPGPRKGIVILKGAK